MYQVVIYQGTRTSSKAATVQIVVRTTDNYKEAAEAKAHLEAALGTGWRADIQLA